MLWCNTHRSTSFSRFVWHFAKRRWFSRHATVLLTFHSISFISIPLFYNIQTKFLNSIPFLSLLNQFHSIPFLYKLSNGPFKLPNKGINLPLPPLKLLNKRREEYSKNIHFILFHSIPSSQTDLRSKKCLLMLEFFIYFLII